SASITVAVTEDGKTETLAFSGDIGNLDQPIIRDPHYLTKADYVIMESTYGDRSHGERPDTVPELAKIIQRTLDRGGNVVVPCFAVGRTQEMLYYLRQVKEQNLVTGHGNWPVYMDSPLAVSATQIVSENYAECFDDDAMELVRAGINPLTFPGLELAVSSEESKALNTEPTPKVILSASGMCEAGRIRHHLKHNLWRKESTVLFVGYQSEGTLGRILVDGTKQVKLFSDTVEVQAEIIVLPGMSGHADDKGLLRWASSFDPKPKKVFVVHGEDTVTDLFAARLHDNLDLDAVAPYPGAVYDFKQGVFTDEGNRERIGQARETEGGKRQSALYDRLLVNLERLTKIVQASEGLNNRDLQSMADSIDTLCEKWK
ncbi:MAG: MBL fold metallo-hydrolase, partial [Oscillospiraceae bacterium]|nr:MBL fold metallo-hydrolase [Oscillospiraceae bacterium]